MMQTLALALRRSAGVPAARTGFLACQTSSILPGGRPYNTHLTQAAPSHFRQASTSSSTRAADAPTPSTPAGSSLAATSGAPADTPQPTTSGVPEAWVDKIHLKGMRFYGYHGALPEETRLGQPFAADVTMYVDLAQAGGSDDLNHTVHYGHAYTVIKEVVEGRPMQLLEAVVETVCSRLLAGFPTLRAVQVHVRKLNIPGMPATLDSVGIEMMRTRRKDGRY